MVFVFPLTLTAPLAATGALSSRSLTPDDDVFQYLAHTYASRNPNMKKGDECKNKMNFPNGVTNGYSWYPLQGEFLFISSIPLIAFTQKKQLVYFDPAVVKRTLGTISPLLCPYQLIS